jgi:ABC-type phosphate/phosphonate transport system substrate-binding protein
MIASLPMYALPDVMAQTEAWWQGLARAFRSEGIAEVPDSLDLGTSRFEHWASPDLLLSQSCGYPLRHDFAGFLRPVATPCYRAEGCAGPSYVSVIAVREDDPAGAMPEFFGRRAAINGWDSHSGMSALRSLAAPYHRGGHFFSEVAVTGSHWASMAAVREGKTDIAAIDCVTYALTSRHAPGRVVGLRILTTSAAVPALPYVTSLTRDDETVRRLRAGIAKAIADPSLGSVRDDLLIADFAVLDSDDYAPIDVMEREATARGYPRID